MVETSVVGLGQSAKYLGGVLEREDDLVAHT